MSTLEAVREEIESVKAELAEAKTKMGYSIDNPGVIVLNQRLTELYRKECLASSVSEPLPSLRYPDSVFIFGDLSTGVFQPTGSCFAISPQYLLTVQHNMETNRHTGYGITPYVSKTKRKVMIPQGYPRPVRVRVFNRGMDYAILELCDDSFDLSPIPISLEMVEADMNLKIFHCPVDAFNEDHVEDLTVFSSWIKTARPTAHHVSCNVGLFTGSSGGPFISRSGGAVGMHVESVGASNLLDEQAVTAMPISDAEEIFSKTTNSFGSTHASFARALLFRKCPQLMRILRELGVI